MSLAPLMMVFWKKQPVSEAQTNTGSVMTLPSVLSREAAKQLVDELPMNQIVNDLAVSAAQGIGTLMLTRSLRPSDYQDLREIPDAMIERIIEALAKKPDLFFKIFSDNLKMQG